VRVAGASEVDDFDGAAAALLQQHIFLERDFRLRFCGGKALGIGFGIVRYREVFIKATCCYSESSMKPWLQLQEAFSVALQCSS
jgi:hypothetical protein